ncbi:YceI family protein [Nibribacter ruber]|uniref:YceI family protein n=1 Tax=Nibribacter ruber TaxID=2698458 RepID=A0A6P1P3L8_9BACT|nr:YceI family protein [Nibribacter ruber]QHL88955.1 YceI family protein [Nibribacter ruber]
MKRIVLSALLAAAVGASAFTTFNPVTSETAVPAKLAAGVQTFKVETTESTLGWIGRKVTGEHNGNLKLQSGSMLFDKSALRGGSFAIDMTSITCNDLQGNSNKNLVNHLRSDDFFSVEKNPTANFIITNLVPKGNAKVGSTNYIVTGNLTIKGITNEITFPAAVWVKKGVATATGTLKFDRTKWDIKFRSGNFFENLGDKAIQDDIELKLNVVAKAEEVTKAKKEKTDKAKVAKS